MKNEIKIISKGSPETTEVFVGEKKMSGVVSCEIGKISNDNPFLTATLVVYVDELDLSLGTKEIVI